MRFRLGASVGLGVGYYLGARAGRERYEQLNRWMRKAKRSEAFEGASEKAKAVIDLGVERAKDAVSDLRDSHDTDTATNGHQPAGTGPHTGSL